MRRGSSIGGKPCLLSFACFVLTFWVCLENNDEQAQAADAYNPALHSCKEVVWDALQRPELLQSSNFCKLLRRTFPRMQPTKKVTFLLHKNFFFRDMKSRQ
jgi:hypothetical protein